MLYRIISGSLGFLAPLAELSRPLRISTSSSEWRALLFWLVLVVKR